jgi:uncharacterized protein YndB with AHSA1/START domain
MGSRPAYVYVTYIESSAERVWQALTQPEITATYWGHSTVSDWQVGSPWELRRTDWSGIADVAGTVIERAPPHRLIMTWGSPGEASAERISRVTFEIEPYHEIVRLTVIHEDLDDDTLASIARGWPAVLASLKSLLETGRVLSRSPWEMPHQRPLSPARTPTQPGTEGEDGDER